MIGKYNRYSKFALIVMAILAVLLFTACYNSKKATDQVNRAILEYPPIAAERLRAAFPCVISSVTHRPDSTDYKKWKDSVVRINDFYSDLLSHIEPETVYDTTINTITDSARIQQLLRNISGYKKMVLAKDEQIKKLNAVIADQKPITDTLLVKDTAGDIIISDLQDKLAKMTLLNAQNKGKSDKWFWIAMGLLLLLVIDMYLRIKSLFKKK